MAQRARTLPDEPVRGAIAVVAPASKHSLPVDLESAANQALQLVTRSTWAEMASYLQQLFGQRLTAAITGVEDARTVGRWIRGQEPQTAYRGRLRDAYQVAKLIELAESRETARAWFLGMNPSLSDAPPAQVIAEDLQEGGRRVMQAARTFLLS